MTYSQNMPLVKPKKQKFHKRCLGSGKLLRILMIEDSESDVVLLEHLLEDATASVNMLEITDVPRLSDGFEVIKTEIFDIIMLDLNLLDIQGIACVAALHAEVPEIPIIVYSGMDDPKLFKEAMLCGAHSYLVKGRETSDNIKKIIISAVKS